MPDKHWHAALQRNRQTHEITDDEARQIEDEAIRLSEAEELPMEKARYRAEEKFWTGLLHANG